MRVSWYEGTIAIGTGVVGDWGGSLSKRPFSESISAFCDADRVVGPKDSGTWVLGEIGPGEGGLGTVVMCLMISVEMECQCVISWR